jgi:hypothetical protein
MLGDFFRRRKCRKGNHKPPSRSVDWGALVIRGHCQYCDAPIRHIKDDLWVIDDQPGGEG